MSPLEKTADFITKGKFSLDLFKSLVLTHPMNKTSRLAFIKNVIESLLTEQERAELGKKSLTVFKFCDSTSDE